MKPIEQFRFISSKHSARLMYAIIKLMRADGMFAENMIETSDFLDERLNVPMRGRIYDMSTVRGFVVEFAHKLGTEESRCTDAAFIDVMIYTLEHMLMIVRSEKGDLFVLSEVARDLSFELRGRAIRRLIMEDMEREKWFTDLFPHYLMLDSVEAEARRHCGI